MDVAQGYRGPELPRRVFGTCCDNKSLISSGRQALGARILAIPHCSSASSMNRNILAEQLADFLIVRY
jgi:hypothetical protein